jgi:hypothetical protein
MEAVMEEIAKLLRELSYEQLGDVRGFLMHELKKKMSVTDLFKSAGEYKRGSE